MKSEEYQNQVLLFQWSEWQSRKIPELQLLYAIPNGGLRDIVTATRLKRSGVKRGVPDISLPVARGSYHGLFIELKSLSGKPTPEQKQWLERLAAEGYMTQVCHGFENARTVILEYLNQ